MTTRYWWLDDDTDPPAAVCAVCGSELAADGTCDACGAATERESCWSCLGVGGYHDCGDDTCCCLYPEDEESDDWWVCEVCKGEGEI